MGSIALANVPPSNLLAGMVVFGATAFGAACAVTAPFRLDRSLVAWVGTRLLAVAVAVRTLLYPSTPALVAYTETAAEVPAVLALSVGSFLALYTAGCVLRGGLRRGRSVVGRVRSVRPGRVDERTER